MIKKTKKPIGVLVDKLYDLRQEIERINAKELKPLQEKRIKLEQRIMDRMFADGTSSVRSKNALVSIKKTRHLSVKDRRRLENYIKKTGAFDLFTNHINSKAFFDRLDEGIVIPGIEVYNRSSLSLTQNRKGK